MVSKPLLAMSNVAELCMNFSFSNIVLCVVPSNILTITTPDISSINGAFNLINFHSFGFNTVSSFGKKGKDLFKNLKQQSLIFMTPFHSNTFLIPNIRSTLSWIYDTNVYISNLWPYISAIKGIMNRTLMNCPFPALILCILDANLGKE